MPPQFRQVHLPPLLPQLPTDLHTPLLSEVFERVLSVCLECFMVLSGVLPATQFAYWEGLLIGKSTCGVLLCVSHIYTQSVLESRLEARIVQIDFSAVFGRVNPQNPL